MKITLIEDRDSELEIILKYPVMNEKTMQVIKKIECLEPKIVVTNETETTVLAFEEIYYVESVDRKTFLYTVDAVYRTKRKVYDLSQEWLEYGFIQVGKATLVNMEHIKSVRPLWNSRLEAQLHNDEKIIIGRTYIKRVKEWLEKEVDGK